MLRRCLPLLLLAVALTGCAQARDTATRAQDCAGLVRDVASSGLTSTPTVEEAEAAVQRLDERVQEIDDPALREAASGLRDRVRELADAARSSDPAGVQQAVDDTRAAARETADLCGVPVDQLLGG